MMGEGEQRVAPAGFAGEHRPRALVAAAQPRRLELLRRFEQRDELAVLHAQNGVRREQRTGKHAFASGRRCAHERRVVRNSNTDPEQPVLRLFEAASIQHSNGSCVRHNQAGNHSSGIAHGLDSSSGGKRELAKHGPGRQFREMNTGSFISHSAASCHDS